MKLFGILFLQIFLCLSVVQNYAQDLTIILVRHAEKEASTKLNNFNPELTEAGKARAEKLLEVLRKYNPDQIFSTNTTRTRATVTPLAVNLNEKYRIQIQIYDSEDLEEFAAKLLASNAKTVIVAGHSNTIPKLANLLIKQDKYPDFGENEYDKIIIVKIKKKKISDTVLQY